MKVKTILLSLLSMFLLVTLSACGSHQSDEAKAGAGVHLLETTEDLEAAIANDEIIYVSKTDCPHCAVFKPKLEEAAEQADVAVYEYDLQLQEEKQNPDLNSHIDLLKVRLVPAVRSAADGEIHVTSLISKSSVEEIVQVLEDYRY